METLTTEQIKEGNELIAKYSGYVKSQFNVQLHSTNTGFAGTSGYPTPFIKKDQYDLLMNAYDSNNLEVVNNFYSNENIKNSYFFDGNPNHLFLTAYNNRTTKLDWLPMKLKYNEDFNLLLKVVEKVEEQLIFNYSGFRLESEKFIQDFENLLEKIGDSIIIKKQKVFITTDIKELWVAVVEFIKWYNLL